MPNFEEILRSTLSRFELSVDDVAINRLCKYNDLLLEWNGKMNLTAITEGEEVALKHFADSLMLLKYVNLAEGASIIDVGTGAGFPGLVLKIARPDLHLTLLDSLQKRLIFLENVCAELGFDDVALVHSRAEDGSHTELRDSFDVAVSRAVAPLNVLSEYDMPFVKVGGVFVAMKGTTADDELNGAQNAITELSGEISENISFTLGEAGERSIIVIKKIAPTAEKYPRRSKKIQTKPL